LVPESIRANIEREDMLDRNAQAGKWLDRIARADDPHLSVVYVRSDVNPTFAEWHGLSPGRWHFRRQNEGAEDTYAPIVNPDGSYREPTFSALEELRNRDLTRQDVRDRVFDRHYRQQKDHEHKRALEEEQRRDELKADIRTAKRIPGENINKRRWKKGLVGS
jgi:hypothetical protein